MIRAPHQLIRTPRTNFELSPVLEDYARILSILDEKQELQRLIDDAKGAHTEFLATLEQKIGELDLILEKTSNSSEEAVSLVQAAEGLVSEAKTIKKGDQGEKGDQGNDAPAVNIDALAERVATEVMSRIRQPKDGETPMVDYGAIIQKVSKLIPKPKKEAKVPKKEDIVQEIFDQLLSGKKKIHVKHLEGFNEGLEQTIGPIRSLAAGFRGGGDVIKAGSNVTVTTDVDGKKVISALTVSSDILTSTGTVDDSNKAFVFTQKPTLINVNGTFYRETKGWSWNAGTLTATLDFAVGTNGDIYGLA